MKLELRKFNKFVDKTFIEGGKEAKDPVLMVSVAAVFKNPWDGKGFVEDLKPIILDLAPKLGDLLVPELIKEIGSPDKILAYGKAGVVGLNGEIEHASAFIHTLRFGNKFRDAVGGTSYLSFTNTRGPAGSKIIELAMKNHEWNENPNLSDIRDLDFWTKDFVKDFD